MQIPRLRAPIVLIHGLLGFDQLRVGPWVVGEYFHSLPAAMRAAGNRVIVAQIGKTKGIAERALELKELLDREVPSEPVHLFGHSMGGLDARFLISRLGLAQRVLTLTTLGTPHRGSSFADWGQSRLAGLVGPMLDLLRVSKQAFLDLTTTSCGAFNEQTPDAPGVRYFSVAGDFPLNRLHPAWGFTGPLIHKREGPNDGLVSVQSATWGESVEVWDADHMNLVNWPHPWVPLGQGPMTKDRLPDYARLLGRLAAEGY
jgi:triacylglycerol lipase